MSEPIRTSEQQRMHDYYIQHAKERRKELLHCELCDIHVTRGSMSAHRKSTRHTNIDTAYQQFLKLLEAGAEPIQLFGAARGL
jgi:hypothetical protein